MTHSKRCFVGFNVVAALATVLCVAAQTAKADNLGNDPCGVTFTVSHPDAIGRPGAYVTQLVYTPPPGFQFTKKDLVKGPSAPKYSWSIDGNGNLVLSMPAPPNQFPQSSTSSSSFQFQKGISSNTGSCNYTTGDLQGMLVRTSLSDGYITTSRFASDGLNVMGGTGTPASDIPATIDPNKFTQLAGAKPCSPGTEMSSDQKLTNGCPDPAKVGAADGDPAKERQPGAIASCTPSGSLSALIQTSPSPATVTAYVPKGTWGPSNTGVRVVSIEPAGGTPAFISTPNPVNSCASNSMTGQTVCVANNTDVYLLSGTTMAPALTSGATGNASFSGGSCQNCGVAINQVTNTAAITMSLLTSPSGTGIQFLNLGTNTFSSPLAAANQVSEGIQWDPSRKLMQLSNEQGVILSPNESGVYDVFDTSSSGTTLEFGNNVGEGRELDTAAADCLTGIALATDEFTNSVYLADMTQATFAAGSPAGTWTSAGQQFRPLPELAPQSEGDAPVSGLAVAPGSHLAVVTGEFGDKKIGALQLPDHSGTGTPDIVDYAVASLPPTPDAQSWAQGLDPHTVTAYVSPNNGKAYALMANSPPPKWIAVVDMQALLNATRISGTHYVDQNPDSATYVDVIATGIVRYVATGN